MRTTAHVSVQSLSKVVSTLQTLSYVKDIQETGVDGSRVNFTQHFQLSNGIPQFLWSRVVSKCQLSMSYVLRCSKMGIKERAG